MLLSLIMAGNGSRPVAVLAEGNTGERLTRLHASNNRDLVYWNVSADGRFAGATNGATLNVAIVDLQAGSVREVTSFSGGKDHQSAQQEYAAGTGAISRDGRQVAYWHYWKDKSGGQLDISARDGKSVSTIFRSKDSDGRSAWGIPRDWSPDGRWIAFQYERGQSNTLRDGITDFLLIPVSGGAPRILKTVEYSEGRYRPRILFSPDGRFVAYEFPSANGQKQTHLFVVPVSGGGETPIAAGAGSDSMVGWAPDGGIVFSSDRAGDLNLYYVAVKNGKQAGEPRLVHRGFGGQALGMTRGGGLIYQQIVTPATSFVATIDFNAGTTSQPQSVSPRFPESNEAAVWSPDGTQIAYIRVPQSGGTVSLILRREGSPEERELVPGVPAPVYNPLAWHPDGRSLLALGQKDAHRGVYRIDSATGEATQIWDAKTGASYPVEWSRDLKWLFHRQGGAKIARRDMASGESTLIYEAEQGRMNNFFRVSPDGTRLAFVQESSTGAAIFTVPTDGGAATPIFTNDRKDARIGYMPGSLAWSADGKYILFARIAGADGDGPSELWIVPSKGGAARNTGITVNGRLGWLNVHPDGTRIAYTQFRAELEYWIAENFLR